MEEQNLKIPNHVAIILDGNGRWAKEKGKKRTDGHYAGYQNLLKLSPYILSKGTKYLSVFAFSTENFQFPGDLGLDSPDHFFASIGQKLVFVADHIQDIFYYAAAILIFAGIIYGYLGIIHRYNLSCTRPIPEYHERGKRS